MAPPKQSSKRGRKLRNGTSMDSSQSSESFDTTFDTVQASVLSGLAVFGDSVWALVFSLSLLVVAICVALSISDNDLDDSTGDRSLSKAYEALPPIPKISPPHIFYATTNKHKQDEEGAPVSLVSPKIRQAFDEDGVVAVRGLLTPDQIDRLVKASDQLVPSELTMDQKSKRKRSERQFHTVQVGAVFLDSPNSTDDKEAITSSAFRDVALFSNIPKFAAELLHLDEERNETMRLLRDIFLAKDKDEYVCGWHVDDTGFWPATADAPGVNAWIAIDDMPTSGGGGFALAIGSHKAPWRQDAHEAIGSTMTFPVDGFKDAEDLFRSRVGSGTCNLRTSAPHLHRRMEETKRIYEIRRGDVIFTDRWIFHRTVPFERSLVHGREQARQGELIFRRYSVRYNPGTARIPKGYGTELSVLWDEANGGRTADEVAIMDGPWYPLCYPSGSFEEMKQLPTLIKDKIPIAEERRKARRKEMQPFLTEIARRQQSRPPTTN